MSLLLQVPFEPYTQRYVRRIKIIQRRSRTHLDPRRRVKINCDEPNHPSWSSLKEDLLARQQTRRRYNLEPYITPATHQLITARQQCAKKLRGQRNERTIAAFRSARMAARKAILADKQQWLADVAKRTSTLFEQGDIHGAYQLLRPLYKSKGKPVSIPSLDHLRQQIVTLLHLPKPSDNLLLPPIEVPTPRTTLLARALADTPLTEVNSIHVFTDGSAAIGEDGVWSGGFGLAWHQGDRNFSLGGRVPQESTSDRAELYAVAAAIALFPHAAHIFIYTDSAYI